MQPNYSKLEEFIYKLSENNLVNLKIYKEMKTKEEEPLSEEERAFVMEGLLSRKIWRFYELLSKWAPILLMLGHWYGVWDYGHYP